MYLSIKVKYKMYLNPDHVFLLRDTCYELQDIAQGGREDRNRRFHGAEIQGGIVTSFISIFASHATVLFRGSEYLCGIVASFIRWAVFLSWLPAMQP